jgi:hypothetical protein
MDSSKTPNSEAQVVETSSLITEKSAPGTITKSEPISMSQVQELLEPVIDFLAKLPDEIGHFFADYKRPLTTLFVFISGIVTVYVTLAVLDAIRDIPLLSPLFELVGLGYTGWFVYRYLLRASTRSELVSEFDALKKQVVGKNQDS